MKFEDKCLELIRENLLPDEKLEDFTIAMVNPKLTQASFSGVLGVTNLGLVLAYNAFPNYKFLRFPFEEIVTFSFEKKLLLNLVTIRTRQKIQQVKIGDNPNDWQFVRRLDAKIKSLKKQRLSGASTAGETSDQATDLTPAPSTPEFKACPFCAEQIKFEAILCRFCQSRLDGA